MYLKIIPILFSLFLTFSPIKGIAHTDFFFSHLGVEHGLSQVSVLTIYQDSQGYLWFGTRNGLNRYDGYEFKVFRNEFNNPNSLSDRYIRAIREDNNKNIWVGTQNGLNCIEYGTGNIHRFFPKEIDSLSVSNAASNILSHADGNLYMIDRSSVFICHSDISVTLYKHLEEKFSIRSICQDTNGDIYIGSDNNGLFVYTSDWQLKKHLEPGENNLPESFITTILPDSEGLWLGTEEQGICFLDRATGKVNRYNKSNTGLGNNTVRSLIFMNEESVLIGTFSGLNILNKNDRTITPFTMNIEGQGSLSHYSIHSMLLDKDQTLWIGTYSAGINYYSPYYKPIFYITSDKYTGIKGKGAQDKDGNLWFATEGSGLFFYNPQTAEQKIYPLMPLVDTNYERNIIKYILLPDNSDEILCTTHFGSVYSFSLAEKRFKLLYDYKENDIYALFIDQKKRLWIPTMSRPYTVVINEEGKEMNRFPVNGSNDYFAQITTIAEIEKDLFVLGSLRDSIYLYDWAKGRKENLFHQLPDAIRKEKLGIITSILHDPDYVWISTTKSGILKFNRRMELIRQYLPADGLSDSYITSMVMDQKGNIWAATANEIFRLNQPSDQFFPIKQAGVPTQEFTFHAGTISSDGTIYFPASQGILAFNPDKLQDNPTIPPLYITSLISNNNKEIVNQMKPAGPDKPQEYSIKLGANQNNLTIRYAALNYIHAEGNQYMFRMDGADNNWQSVANRREAYYSNLHPGNYTFRVKASNNDGLWNPKETLLHITILPPLYKTWWAYTIYLLCIAFISYRIYCYQHRKHELERDIRFKQKEQERMKELHEERLRMFNNFSHELRTPLTLIINPLDELLQNISFSQEVKQALKRMKKNTQRMLTLVNNLMDIQKYEAGQSKLEKKMFNMSAFINDIYQSFSTVAERRKITFTLENQLADPYLVSYDEEEIEKVFFNLLSNAFKFTPPEGKVDLLVKKATPKESPANNEAEYLYIEVRDNGKGFSREEGEKIFEPFYQFKKDIHQEISGTGIGLSLSRSIVDQHHGYIRAESTPETGTRFMLFLPDTEEQHTEEVIRTFKPSSKTDEKTQFLLNEVDTRTKQTILIADDDPEIRDYLKQQLEGEYKIRLATNGKEALEEIKETLPNLLLSDVIMPEMNGIDLCRQIRTTPSLSHLPVILLTAKSSNSQIEEGWDTGADDYIIKPFQISLLKARIRNLLSSNRKIQTTQQSPDILQVLGIEIDSNKDEFLTQYIQIVKDNITNPELDISLIYNTLGMSRANFYRKVKNLTGLSPIELIRNIRLQVGAQLLRETDLNISEIAQKTGFSSRSYFARNFKLVYGISPSEYQEKAKN